MPRRAGCHRHNEYWLLPGGFAALKVGPDHICLLDAADLVPVLARARWYIHRKGDRVYVRCSARDEDGQRVHLSLHRFLLSPPEGLYVDHINGDGLDNRRCNLRLCTNGENQQNQRRAQKNSATRLKNVYLQKNGKYRVEVRAYGKRKYIGVYGTEKEAAVAAARARARFQPFAPESSPQTGNLIDFLTKPLYT